MKIMMDDIRAKVKSHCEDDRNIRERMQDAVDEYMLSTGWSRPGGGSTPTVEEAGLKFANLLLHLIYSNQFMPNLEGALEDVEVGEPFKLSNGHYGIYVYFENDLKRHSMSTLKDYPPVNLAWLYSDGVDHIMRPIYEWEDGMLRRTKTEIPHTGFIQQAINDFMGNYAGEYNVTRIELSDAIEL